MKNTVILVLVASLLAHEAAAQDTVVFLHATSHEHLRSAPSEPQAIAQQAITAAVASACSLTPPYHLVAEEAEQVRACVGGWGARCVCPPIAHANTNTLALCNSLLPRTGRGDRRQ